MKALFHGSSAEAGHEGTDEHGAFDAEPEAFGVLAKEGGGGGPHASEGHVRRHQDPEDGERHEAGEGAAPGRREAMTSSPGRTEPDRRHTVQQRAHTAQGVQARERASSAALRNQAAPVRTIQGFQFQTPNSGDVSTRVDPCANNMFMGSLKEKDAEGVTRTKCRCNLMGRMKRSHQAGGVAGLREESKEAGFVRTG